MSQAELFPADPPALAIDHGGYNPASPRWYRGRQIPATYMDQQGMRTFQLPTLVWLLDEIMEALRGGPILSRELHLYTASAVRSDVVARHMHLLADIGLIKIDYRFDYPRDRGGSDPAVVELLED